MNFDISMFKNIPVGGTRRLQFRFELYNAFNQDEWTGVNTSAQFDYTTQQLTNPTVVRLPVRRDTQRPAHPARREIHVLTAD